MIGLLIPLQRFSLQVGRGEHAGCWTVYDLLGGGTLFVCKDFAPASHVCAALNCGYELGRRDALHTHIAPRDN